MRNIKILIKNYVFSGGAPRSLLQYAKIFISKGIEVISVGEFSGDNIINEYRENKIKTYNIKAFKRMMLFNNLRSFLQLVNLVKSERPDIIVTVGDLDASFCSIIGKYFNIKVVIVVAGGPNPYSDVLLDTFMDNQIILFSKENELYYIKHGIESNRLTVISNRIEVEEDHQYLKHYKELNDEGSILYLLIVSRVDEDKIDSILHVIEQLNRISIEVKNIRVFIAGSGNCEQQLYEAVENINNNSGFKIINTLGHVDDMKELFTKTHVVFGKGRSVIEPMMMNRIGVVLGDKDDLSICRSENFDNLYEYNFSGRNIIEGSDNTDLVVLFKSLIDGKYDYSRIKEISNVVREQYDSCFLEDALMQLLNMPNSHNVSISILGMIRSVVSFFMIYVKLTTDFIKRRFGVKR